MLCTRLSRKEPLKTAFSVQRSDGYAMLMGPNKGETAAHGCHPGDMDVRMREVLTRPWVGGMCAPCFKSVSAFVETSGVITGDALEY